MNKILALIVLTFALALAPTAEALTGGPWQVFQQNIKLPKQEVLQHARWTAPAAAAATFYKSAGAITNGVATTITATAVPAYTRNVTITPTGTTANVGACTAVVTGTDAYGKALTENFAIGATQATATVGAKAFKTVTSVAFPAAMGSGAGVTVSIGTGAVLGRGHCADTAGDYAWSIFNGAFETTRGVMAAHATDISQNTFTPNGTLDGVKDVELFYVQNYRCFGN